MKNDYQQNAFSYAKHELTGTGYLAFKKIPSIISQYSNGNKTLDYGCGTGRSTRFLKNIGLDVEGVDISQDMLIQAKNISNDISYTLIESANTKANDDSYDIVFSSLVLFEISTKEELERIFCEVYRILKKDGIFVTVTGSMDMYNHDWLSLDVDFPENENLTSGAIAKVLIKDIKLELYDYYWTHDDYKKIINKSHFDLLETILPLGDENDGYIWKSEKYVSPYIVYVMRK